MWLNDGWWYFFYFEDLFRFGHLPSSLSNNNLRIGDDIRLLLRTWMLSRAFEDGHHNPTDFKVFRIFVLFHQHLTIRLLNYFGKLVEASVALLDLMYGEYIIQVELFQTWRYLVLPIIVKSHELPRRVNGGDSLQRLFKHRHFWIQKPKFKHKLGQIEGYTVKFDYFGESFEEPITWS